MMREKERYVSWQKTKKGDLENVVIVHGVDELSQPVGEKSWEGKMTDNEKRTLEYFESLETRWDKQKNFKSTTRKRLNSL